MNAVLLDTGVIVALVDRSEKHHQACVDALEETGGRLVTCEAVLTEACYLLRGIHGAPQAVLANVKEGIFRVPFASSESAESVASLLTKYRDVPMDFADACLVQLADMLGTGRILTLDSDFAVYRWRKRRRFECIVPLA
jgi:predicted nucleic acid-binding protein